LLLWIDNKKKMRKYQRYHKWRKSINQVIKCPLGWIDQSQFFKEWILILSLKDGRRWRNMLSWFYWRTPSRYQNLLFQLLFMHYNPFDPPGAIIVAVVDVLISRVAMARRQGIPSDGVVRHDSLISFPIPFGRFIILINIDLNLLKSQDLPLVKHQFKFFLIESRCLRFSLTSTYQYTSLPCKVDAKEGQVVDT